MSVAKGGTFTNSVVHERTLFRFARGGKIGEMGEAGPEAIMPLQRDSRGRLGVIAQGGGGDAPQIVMPVYITNNNSNARVQTQRRNDGGLDVVIDELEAALGARVDNGLGLARNMGNRFALNDGAGLIR
jgi:phage-related minor tail protein